MAKFLRSKSVPGKISKILLEYFTLNLNTYQTHVYSSSLHCLYFLCCLSGAKVQTHVLQAPKSLKSIMHTDGWLSGYRIYHGSQHWAHRFYGSWLHACPSNNPNPNLVTEIAMPMPLELESEREWVNFNHLMPMQRVLRQVICDAALCIAYIKATFLRYIIEKSCFFLTFSDLFSVLSFSAHAL